MMKNLSLKETAVGLHELYVNLQEAGFTKEEAMFIITEGLNK